MTQTQEVRNLRQYIVSQRISIVQLNGTISVLKGYIKDLENSIKMREASMVMALPPPA